VSPPISAFSVASKILREVLLDPLWRKLKESVGQWAYFSAAGGDAKGLLISPMD